MYDSRIANEYSSVTCGCGCKLSDCGCINCHCIIYEENVSNVPKTTLFKNPETKENRGKGNTKGKED